MERQMLILLFVLLTSSVSFSSSVGNISNATSIYARIINNGQFYSVNATPNTINAAESYLSQRLGASYAKTHFSLGFHSIYVNYTSNYYSDTGLSYVYFSYNVTFENGSSAVKSNYVYAPLFVAIILNKNNNIRWYFGPSMPYVPNLSPNQIVTIALSHGFKDAKLNYGYSLIPAIHNTSDSSSGYSIAWIVTGKYDGNGTFHVLYIDPETGNILGEGYGFSSPGGTLPNPQFPYPAYLGNFSIFRLNGTSSNVMPYGSGLIWQAYAIIAILVISLTIMALIYRKKRDK